MLEERLNGVAQDDAGEAIPRPGQFVSGVEDTTDGETRSAGSDLLSSGGGGGWSGAPAKPGRRGIPHTAERVPCV